MKKFFIIIFLTLFLFSCWNSSEEINNLKKEISELKKSIEIQNEYINNISCSNSVNSFISARNTKFNNIATSVEDYFYSKKKKTCVTMIKYLERYYVYDFWKNWYSIPLNGWGSSFEEAIKIISEYRWE